MNDRLRDAVPDPAIGQSAVVPFMLAFLAAIVLSAALLFSVQPMFTKMILPRFGGSAAVWSVAIVFFQAALLAGYGYAHAVARRATPRAGIVIHLAVLGAGALLLPLAPAAGFEAGAGDEWLALFALFGLSLGLPFAALSANAPLIQAWYARSGLRGADNPYGLYAASNAGSLAALLAYPTLIEPYFPLRGQAWAWSIGYGVLMLLIAVLVLVPWPRPERDEGRDGGFALPRAVLLGCLFYGFVPSAGLVAVTAHLSTDVAAAPFLWVVPLALYLLSFVIAFGAGGSGWVRPLGILLMPALVILTGLLLFAPRLPIMAAVPLHLGAFFALSLYMNGRLWQIRPPARDLTAFYLAQSLGGVLGGLFAAVLSPQLFSFVAEYPLVLIAATAALPWRGRWVAAGLAMALIVARFVPLDDRTRETFRSFYGLHTVETTADGMFRILRHGVEIHGAQRLLDDAGQPVTGLPVPLTYYHEEGPISEAIDAARAKAGGKPIRIGIIGLGAGSIACLADRADTLAFYEIDPLVIDLARDASKFRFLSACAPNADIITGDARLSLGHSDRTFDLIIVDAFSSDAIPVHLLTREALELYFRRLSPDGMVALHISNNHLKLDPYIAATAAGLGLSARLHDEFLPRNAVAMAIQPMVMALARKPADFGPLNQNDDWLKAESKEKPWTDDFSNLFGAFLANLRAH